ncbi:TetR/AcrR family transcriptional regulator [Consotaella aegiceratis]|uniref:TetR/AcrR family transcriptional regulator n=1 Tax=Consotaella aegiceratis TaxID=3097961 RepID=UPI002F3F8201
MSSKTGPKIGGFETGEGAGRRPRADALRNLDALVQAAKSVFATSGVDAPVRQIADMAGVGVGTVYRHFPQRSDLIVAVFRKEIDACVGAASTLAAENEPGEALALWMQRFVDFIETKRGLGAALHSGDPAYESLPAYFEKHLVPALQSLLDEAAAVGAVRSDADATELLNAAASLGASAYLSRSGQARRMVALLVDGLRYGAASTPS